MKTLITFSLSIALIALASCDPVTRTPSSDEVQRHQQERILKEGTAQTGMPNIKNFRERKILKDIIELRDQNGLTTYSYIFCPYLGKFAFIGNTVGYGIPYATQYTSPQRPASHDEMGEHGNGAAGYPLPQADPNALFSPASADGTWILMVGPDGKTTPQYIEERLCVFTYRLPDSLVVKQ